MLEVNVPDLLTTAVVLVTFVVLAVPRVGNVVLSRALTAALGAVVVVALGSLVYRRRSRASTPPHCFCCSA